ncbi:MAG: 50S ribosomal protein L18 [Thermoanaerobaculales bacterium]|nr:50S ribosomal protein L18 [Thermoanaerobaculales bacterium]
MSRLQDRKKRRERVKRRYRHTVSGTASRPRLAVFRSLRHVYAQVIDDENGVTLAAASSLEKEVSGSASHSGNAESGKLVGAAIAERAKEKGIETVVFDRGGFNYHGVISAIAEAAREGGLKF